MPPEITCLFTPEARLAMTNEGHATHSMETAEWPFIPTAGDLISWDWMCDGKAFIVRNRLLAWNDHRACVVTLLLDLPEGRDR